MAQREPAASAPLLAERPIETASDPSTPPPPTAESSTATPLAEPPVVRRPGLGAPLGALPASARPFNLVRDPQAPRPIVATASAPSSPLAAQRSAAAQRGTERVVERDRARGHAPRPELGPVALESDHRGKEATTSSLIGSRDPLTELPAARQQLTGAVAGASEAATGPITLQLLRSDEVASGERERDVATRGFASWPWVESPGPRQEPSQVPVQMSRGVASSTTATRTEAVALSATPGASRAAAPVVVRPDSLQPLVQLPGGGAADGPSTTLQSLPPRALQRETPSATQASNAQNGGVFAPVPLERTPAPPPAFALPAPASTRVPRRLDASTTAERGERAAPVGFDVARGPLLEHSRAEAVIQRSVLAAASPSVPAVPSAPRAMPAPAPTVQRAQESGAVSSSVTSDTASASDADGELSTEGVHKLVNRIYPMISYLLRRELGIDRDRAGMTTGLHR